MYQTSSINRLSVPFQYSTFASVLDLRSRSPSRASIAPDRGIYNSTWLAQRLAERRRPTLRKSVQSRIVIAVRKFWDRGSASRTPRGSRSLCSCFSRCKSGDWGNHLRSWPPRNNRSKSEYRDEPRSCSTTSFTLELSPETRLRGQKPFLLSSLRRVPWTLACFITLKAQVLHRLLPFGALGLCTSHFGLNSIPTLHSSEDMSETRVPYPSFSST